MSIAELSLLVNNNFDKPLNEQMRDLKYLGSYLFVNDTSFSPDKSGWYKIICVGKGGATQIDSEGVNYGGSGGVAISTLNLISTESYKITISTQQHNASSFDEKIFAYGGGDGYSSNGVGGVASGGQFNYNGLSGSSATSSAGADVGVFIPELMKNKELITSSTLTGQTYSSTHSVSSGFGILGYGGGQGGRKLSQYNSILSPISTGCVLIIPLELTE